MLRRVIGEDVAARRPFPRDGSARVQADRGQMEQAILNLARQRARRDAARRHAHHRRHDAEVPAERRRAAVRGLHPGAYVALTVARHRQRHRAATCSRGSSSPSSRPRSRARAPASACRSVYGIVTQSGGHIARRQRERTRHDLQAATLPRCRRTARPARRLTTRPPVGGPGGGAETILLVEDERRPARHDRGDPAGSRLPRARSLDRRAGADALRASMRPRPSISSSPTW